MTNYYLTALEATSNLSIANTGAEQVAAQTGNIYGQVLNGIYENAQKVLQSDYILLVNATSKEQAQDQEKYSMDSTAWGNLETVYNGLVNASQSNVTNLSQAQEQLVSFGSTINSDGTYMSQAVSGSLS